MRFRTLSWFILFVGLMFPGYSIGQEKAIVGWLERVRISPENLVMRAKLDHARAYSDKVVARNQAWPKPFACADRQLVDAFFVVGKNFGGPHEFVVQMQLRLVSQVCLHGARGTLCACDRAPCSASAGDADCRLSMATSALPPRRASCA